MELEQRIKALEYELKILKNEIQRTLLDIQEQVLIHYYPTLRTEDSAPSADAIAQLANRPAPTVAAAPAGVSTPPVPIAAKKVSLDEVRAAQAPKLSGSVDQGTMVKLLEWVNDTTAKLGGGRSTKLIDTCVTKAILDADTKAILQRVTSLNKAPDPERVPSNDCLTAVLRLDEVLGRAADVDEALGIIEEANLG